MYRLRSKRIKMCFTASLVLFLLKFNPLIAKELSVSDRMKVLKILKKTSLNIRYAKTVNPHFDIEKTVKPYIGKVKYVWGGASLKKGMDCSSFTRFVFKKKGVHLKRTSKEQSRQGKYVEPNKLKTGDLIFFDASTSREGIDHVGIYLDHNNFVHCVNPDGVILQKTYNYKFPIKFGRRI